MLALYHGDGLMALQVVLEQLMRVGWTEREDVA
jgi:hypothetical protein